MRLDQPPQPRLHYSQWHADLSLPTRRQSIGLFGGAGGGAATAAAGQEFELSARRLRVVRQLGEGGYSFVYLVREVEAAGGGGLLPTGAQVYALKRVRQPACWRACLHASAAWLARETPILPWAGKAIAPCSRVLH